MNLLRFSRRPAQVAAALLVLSAPELASADTFSPGCDKGGDQAGFAIATNGDFNGDGVNDIAIGAPCYYVRNHPHAGRVVIVDGRNGRRLFRKRGGQDHQWFGSALSFIPDLNGDGRDEIAVGSPGYDLTPADQGDPLAGYKEKAGRIDVYQKRRRRLRVFGINKYAGFGEKIAPLNDINDDGKADFVVSATGDRNLNGTTQDGRIWLVSGKNGDLLGYRVGPIAGNNYGRSLAAATDLDGDGKLDFIAGTDLANGPSGVLRAGVVDAVSSMDLQADPPLFQVYGAHRDKLGRTADFAGDVNDDDIPDVIAGSDGSDDTGVKQSGLVTLFSLDGRRLWARADDKGLQEGANFGDAVARIGDINGDGVTDFGATAPKEDYVFNGKLAPDCGRVVAMSGVDGSEIWSVDGTRRFEEFGYALDGDIDFDLDEVPDLVVGTPGDDPFGRRGAGSVRILSGVDGHVLRSFAGRRGLETRIATVTLDSQDVPRIRSFSRTGKRTEMNQPAIENTHAGEFSISILNDNPFNAQGDPHIPRPQGIQVAVTGGYDSNNSQVQVWRLGRRTKLIDSFDAFDDGSPVECAGGEVNGRVNEELVCAQASGAQGNVKARIFERLEEEVPFFLSGELQLFKDTDKYNGALPIDAEGANLEIGNVTGDKANEIVVGPTRGVPVVRIFALDGTLIREFLAYDPVLFSGVDIALIDLDGSGDKLILTAPRHGEALIKVFNGDGQRVNWGPLNTPIGFSVVKPPYDGGARVAAADVDRDDQQEIIVYIAGPDDEQRILAYEPTNKLTADFTPFNPFPGGKAITSSGAVTATDRWVRH